MAVPATTGVLRTKVSDMEIGDYIKYQFNATPQVITSLLVGNEVTATTEGSVLGQAYGADNTFFGYMVKVAKGLLVCDRVTSYNISWDTLNSIKRIQGIPYDAGNIIPTMTSNTAPSGVASASGFSSGYEPWRAFDKTTPSAWLVDPPQSWLSYQFTSAKNIKKYIITGVDSTVAPNHSLNRNPKAWTFEGSNDGTNWKILDARENKTWNNAEKKSFNINNNESFLYYRINVSSNVGGTADTHLVVTELEMFETAGIIRSLTGGVAYADANGNKSTTDLGKGGWPVNEWDKYISNWPIEKIQVGKTLDDVFHWNGIWSWTQDTPIIAIATNERRIIRGKTTVNNFVYDTSNSVFNVYGFRPVFEFQE
jgi:hypothetical protein